MTRTVRGTVTSDRMDKTITVKVVTQKQHPLYRKKYQASAKFKAHDEKNQAAIGDLVEISETRPLSHDKHWVLVRKLMAKDVEAKS